MSGQTAGGLLARLRHVAATSGPAVMIAVPVVLAGALLFRGLEMSSLGRPKDVTLADGGQRSLLLSAVSGTTTDVKPALKPGLKPVTGRSAGLRRMASVHTVAGHTVGVTRTGLRRVSLSRGSQLAMSGTSSGTSGLFGGSGPGGGAAAERSSIRAHLVYERETTACPSLTTVISRGGLEGSLAVAISGAEAAARHRGASAVETQAMIQRAVQSALIASGAAPRDVLVAVQDLSQTYTVCGGDPATVAVLGGLGGVIRAQLNYSEPAVTGGPGPAPIGNPFVPLPGGLGTASYLRQGQGH